MALTQPLTHPLTQPLTQTGDDPLACPPEPLPESPPAPKPRAMRLLLWTGLLSTAGILVFLVLVFQPFADAAGGCGGG